MALRAYTFFKLNGRAKQPSFDLVGCESDADARRHALKMLADAPEHVAIEVSDGTGSPFMVERAPRIVPNGAVAEGRTEL